MPKTEVTVKMSASIT